KKAATMLVEEVEKRSQIRWATAASAGSGPAIVLERSAPPGPAEGYRIHTEAGKVTITGNDARGVLFGIGRLLRALHMKPGSAILPEALNVTTTPKYSLRGHQLGYRPKTNSYDGWPLPVWE